MAQPSGSPAGLAWPPAWRMAWASLGLSLLAANVLLFQTLASMVQIWNGSSTYNYCLLIPLISVYVAWQRRAAIAPLAPRPSALGMLFVLGFGCLWLVADAASLNEGRHAALIGINQSLILAILGGEVARRLAFPILYLWLALPTGLFLLGPLQSLAADMSTHLLRISGIPVFQQGTLLEVPSGRYVVAEVCAGLNFLLASLALSLVYANLLYKGWIKRTLAVAIALLIALVANWLRIWGIIAFNHMTGGGIDIGGDHLIWGWGFFAIVCLVTMLFGLAFRDDEDEAATTAETRSATLASRGTRAGTGRRLAGAGALAIGLLVLPLAYSEYTISPVTRVEGPAVMLVPAQPWRAIAPSNDWSPIHLGADRRTRTAFASEDGTVEIYVAQYSHEAEGRKLIAHGNELYDPKAWRLLGRGAASLTLNGRESQVSVVRLIGERERREIWYWYLVDGRVVTSLAMMKLLQAKARLLGGTREASVIAISVDTAEGAGAGLLRRFAAETRFQPEAWFAR
ncbi:MAG: EpsI family protein [Alphaproteobacteria bacterium]|nr:EpsI family protein [Alphaproteobacteria bacterium]